MTAKIADVVVHKEEPHAHGGDTAPVAVGVVEQKLLVDAGGAATKIAGLEDKYLAHGSGGARTGLGNGAVRGRIDCGPASTGRPC